MNSQSLRFRLFTLSLFSGLAVSSLHSATVNWDGGFVGGANNSGNWTDAANWSTDVVPLSPANTSDDVKFLDVTTGTRTVSINNGDNVTAKTIDFTQTTAGASNILSIASGGMLNLNSAQTWAAPTAGTSRVDLGGTVNFSVYNSGTVTVNTALTFTNAGANFTHGGGSANSVFNFNGAVNVNAGSGTAQISDSTAHSITSTFGSASSLLINTGTLEFTTTAFSANPGISVTVQGATTIASGAGLKLTTDSGNNAGGGSSGVSLTNSSTGTLTQAGTITTNGRGSSGTATLTNSGAWKVNGTGAVIEKSNRSTAANPTFVNSAAAVFSGATLSDKIDFNHLTTPGTDLAFTNSGVIAAGNGSGGSGLTSVGTLTFVDFAITNSVSTSSLTFDIGGTTSGQFDVIALQSSSMTLTNATLAINLVNGFAPSSSFSVDILTSDVPSSVSGSFVGLTVNGSANSDYSFSYNSSTGIGTLSYTASSIPEPSTYAITAGVISLGMVSLRRRRGKNVSG
jgi:hypothetical protein